MTKTCSRCKIEKEFDKFWSQKSRKDGLQSSCVDCKTAYNKIYNQKNADKIAAYNKIYSQENADAIAAYRKIYSHENADAIAAYSKIYNQENADKIAAYHKIYRYKLTDEQYKQMLADQNNSCKTCKIEFDSTSKSTKPHIDHDHKCCEGKRSCGKCVRGILCHRCNTSLGYVNDSIQTLQNMVNYLKEYA